MLSVLSSGFLKGGTGFLKGSSAGDMIMGGAGVNREIRVGVTHVNLCIIPLFIGVNCCCLTKLVTGCMVSPPNIAVLVLIYQLIMLRRK